MIRRRTTCRNPRCGRRLTDGTSLMFGYGPECRRDLTPDQLRAARALTSEENSPGYIPEDKAPSPAALHNNAVARAAAGQPGLCHHHNVTGRCGQCRIEADPTRAAERIIREIQAERRAASDARYEAYQAHLRTTAQTLVAL